MENIINWIEVICALLAGLATAIPLVVKLTATIEAAIKEKNWNQLLNMAMPLMAEAEEMFQSGEEKKQYVLNSLKVVANSINYNYDEEAEAKMSDMINSICNISKLINVK